MLADSAERFESNLKAMSEVLSRWELNVNWKKTTVMRVARQKRRCKVRIGDMKIEQVDEMKYLGVMISSNGSMRRKLKQG